MIHKLHETPSIHSIPCLLLCNIYKKQLGTEKMQISKLWVALWFMKIGHLSVSQKKTTLHNLVVFCGRYNADFFPFSGRA